MKKYIFQAHQNESEEIIFESFPSTEGWDCASVYDVFYQKGICFEILKSYIHDMGCEVSNGIYIQEGSEHYMKVVKQYSNFFQLSRKCKESFFKLLCIHIYQPCNNNIFYTLTSKLCRQVQEVDCKDFWPVALGIAEADRIAKNFIPRNCELFHKRNYKCKNVEPTIKKSPHYPGKWIFMVKIYNFW